MRSKGLRKSPKQGSKNTKSAPNRKPEAPEQQEKWGEFREFLEKMSAVDLKTVRETELQQVPKTKNTEAGRRIFSLFSFQSRSRST